MRAPMVENTFRKNVMLIIVLAYSLSRPIEILAAVTCSHLARRWYEATQQAVSRCFERQPSTMPENQVGAEARNELGMPSTPPSSTLSEQKPPGKMRPATVLMSKKAEAEQLWDPAAAVPVRVRWEPSIPVNALWSVAGVGQASKRGLLKALWAVLCPAAQGPQGLSGFREGNSVDRSAPRHPFSPRPPATTR